MKIVIEFNVRQTENPVPIEELNCLNETICVFKSDSSCFQATTQAHSSYGLKVEFSPDSTTVVTCGADCKINVIKTADLSSIATHSLPSMKWVWDCAFSADSNFLVTASSDGTARLWNLSTGEAIRQYQGNQKPLTCLAFRDRSLDNYH